MPIKIKREFEREYMEKGKSKREADRIFYSWENKHRLMGVNFKKKISPSTYPIKINPSEKKVMGVELRKPFSIGKSNPYKKSFKKIKLFERKY